MAKQNLNIPEAIEAVAVKVDKKANDIKNSFKEGGNIRITRSGDDVIIRATNDPENEAGLTELNARVDEVEKELDNKIEKGRVVGQDYVTTGYENYAPFEISLNKTNYDKGTAVPGVRFNLTQTKKYVDDAINELKATKQDTLSTTDIKFTFDDNSTLTLKGIK